MQMRCNERDGILVDIVLMPLILQMERQRPPSIRSDMMFGVSTVARMNQDRRPISAVCDERRTNIAKPKTMVKVTAICIGYKQSVNATLANRKVQVQNAYLRVLVPPPTVFRLVWSVPGAHPHQYCDAHDHAENARNQ